MTRSRLSAWAILLFFPAAILFAAQEKSTPKTAAQQFKNVQVLKDIPADQLVPTMQFISGSLGVDCEFCHVQHAMDKDDKKEKKVAREMISMELAINKNHFENEITVTCYTCHRGSPHPVGTPILTAGAAPAPPHEHEHTASAANLPSPEQILAKYLAAVGGPTALEKVKTRVQKGSIDAGDSQYPIEIYSEGPDKRVSISHPSFGDSVTAFNGQAGWLTTPGGVRPMGPLEAESARLDAQLYFPARVRELYKEFTVAPGETISGHATYLIKAQAPSRLPLNLYFDQDSGLLLRMQRFLPTPLGKNPTQVDYADYRVFGDVKIPYQWMLTRTSGSFTIRINDVQQNVPVDEKLFVMPPPSAPH